MVKKMFTFDSLARGKHFPPGDFVSVQVTFQAECYAELCPVHRGGRRKSQGTHHQFVP